MFPGKNIRRVGLLEIPHLAPTWTGYLVFLHMFGLTEEALEPETGPKGQAPQAANDSSRPGDEATARAAGAPSGERPADVRAELEAATRKAVENYELYLRARAEADNTRRRAAEEIAKVQKFAVESFAEALLPVADSLERALDAANAADPHKLREGVQITLRQLLTAFEKFQLTEINPAGEKFDPHRHQAISTVPADSAASAPPNHVVAVLQKGWMIADRVLRPALVTVSQGT